MRLTFKATKGTELITLGVGPDDSPFFNVNGPDGRRRFTVHLTTRTEPILALSDARVEGRIIIGQVLSDSPSPSENTWGVAIREGDSADIRAALLVGRGKSDQRSLGILSLRGPGEHLSLLPGGQQLRSTNER
jgi:hypothetical protein